MATIFEFPYRTVVEVNLQAIVKNLSHLRQKTQREVIPVIKADAYGHGMIPVAKVLLHRGGIQMVAVATLEEAIELRQHFHRHFQILVLSGFMPHQIEAYRNYNLTPMLHSLYHVYSLRGIKHLPSLHLKVDTGMNRLGVRWEEKEEVISVLRELPDKLAGFCTHLAESESTTSDFSALQLENFGQWLDCFRGQGLLATDARIHVANSGGILFQDLGMTNAVRPGLSLLGVSPNPLENEQSPLVPALTWKSRLLSRKKIQKGDYVGYGRAFCAKKEMILGVVPVGYADGYPWALGNRGEVLLHGKRAPVLGRVSMDMMTVDLTHIESAKEGDLVTLIGKQNQESVSVWDLARAAQTLAYEVFCGVSPRVSRIYLDSDAT